MRVRRHAANLAVMVALVVLAGCGTGHATLQEIRDQSSSVVTPGSEDLGGAFESAPSASLLGSNDGSVERIYGTNDSFAETVAYFETNPDLELGTSTYETEHGQAFLGRGPFGPDGDYRIIVRVQDHPFDQLPDGSPLPEQDWNVYVEVVVGGPPG